MALSYWLLHRRPPVCTQAPTPVKRVDILALGKSNGHFGVFSASVTDHQHKSLIKKEESRRTCFTAPVANSLMFVNVDDCFRDRPTMGLQEVGGLQILKHDNFKKHLSFEPQHLLHNQTPDKWQGQHIKTFGQEEESHNVIAVTGE
ncbi:hypothetical protein R6Q59_034706 [Mikania micrantha]